LWNEIVAEVQIEFGCIFVLETDSIASNNGSWKLFFHAITVQLGLGPETQLVPAGCGASIQAFIVDVQSQNRN
jgi:hypothetical protein